MTKPINANASGRHDEEYLTIAGYTDRLSVEAGDQIALHISTRAKHYALEIARIGAAREVVWTKDGLPGVEHPVPKNASTHGCYWPVALRLSVPTDWRSGYYSVILRAADDGQVAQGEMSFVVRSAHPGRDTKILLQRTTNTDNAYNSWGGTTLYNGPDGPGRRVSFDRPFAGFRLDPSRLLFRLELEFQASLDRSTISEELMDRFSSHKLPLSPYHTIETERSGERWHLFDPGAIYTIIKDDQALCVYNGFSVWESCWHHWEQPFVQWAERAGYRFDYAANSDLEFHHEILEHYQLVLSVGHDEYWSSPMRDNLEAFIANGGNVAFFSGNAVFWQVRSEAKGRALVCWKDYHQDPVYQAGDHRLLSTVWCHRLIGRPENQLTGVSFVYGGYHRFFDQYNDSPGAYTVHRPDHWIFEGTGLKRGDQLGSRDRIIGYECDGCDYILKNGLPVPTHRDGTPDTFQILATAPAGLSDADQSIDIATEALDGEGTEKRQDQPGAAVLGIYTRDGTVVTVGCTEWSNGLKGRDPKVEQITRNVLDRLSR